MLKSGAKFDPEKALWFQNHYFQNILDSELVPAYRAYTKSLGVDSGLLDTARIIELVKPRASFVRDLWTQSAFFFEAPTAFDPQGVKKAVKTNTCVLLSGLGDFLGGVADFTQDALSERTKTWALDNDFGLGAVMMPLRLALVGSMQGPDVFAIMAVLGQKETRQRIAYAITSFG